MLLSSISAVVSRLSRRCTARQSPVAMATAGRRLCTNSDYSAHGMEDESSDSENRKKMRYNFLGGDHNQVTLVGTVTKVTEKQAKKATGPQPYVMLRVMTMHFYKDDSGQVKSVRNLHLVSVFSYYLLRIARKVSPGDRVFITGRLDYFYVNQTPVAAVHPSRIIPMLPKFLPQEYEQQQQQQQLQLDDEFEERNQQQQQQFIDDVDLKKST